ncbi:MAG: YHYH protein [Pseudomonadota bacterium]
MTARALFALPALLLLPLQATAHNMTVDGASTLFDTAQLVGEPKMVDCTLSGGAETTCVSITVKPAPTAYEPGPWCPSNISDGADAGGIWLEGGEVYDVDGAFIANLAEFYDDPNWQLFDPETGEINVTETLEAFEAAARPDVAEEYQNYCVEGQMSFVDDALTMTYVIPLEPVAADSPSTRQDNAGVAFNGVRLDAPAPTEAILGAYTIAAFDDCGGHVNPFVGYHYHAVTDCQEQAHGGDHAALIGVAMDGYLIYAHELADGSAPADLDACYGHETDAEGYHYHAGAAGSNQILGCHRAQVGCSSTDPDAVCDATARRGRP